MIALGLSVDRQVDLHDDVNTVAIFGHIPQHGGVRQVQLDLLLANSFLVKVFRVRDAGVRTISHADFTQRLGGIIDPRNVLTTNAAGTVNLAGTNTLAGLVMKTSGTAEIWGFDIDKDPRNVVALTWLAWSLELTSSSLPVQQAVELQTSAEKLIDRAIEVDPEYSYARAFRAVIAYRNGHYADAKQYLADFRAANPSTDAEGVIEQMDLEANITKALEGTTTTTTP